MSRVHYNEEMKLQTVKLVLKGEKSTSRVARSYATNFPVVKARIQEKSKAAA